MSAVAFIFARGGSKGLPGKNTRLMGDKPLIALSIEHALSVRRIDRVIVSTDSVEIAEIAKKYGAEVPFIRPAELAQDGTPEWLAWRHALSYVQESSGCLPDVMVSLPTTAPLRLPLDVENCLDEYQKGGVDMVIAITPSHRNPHFNMVTREDDGMIKLANSSIPGISGRQYAPIMFDITTVCYVANPNFVMNHQGIFEGKIRAIEVPAERAIDIDTLLDFEIAQFLLAKRSSRL